MRNRHGHPIEHHDAIPNRICSTCREEDPLLACEGLVVGYGGRPLLPPIDFVLFHGELCAVVGRNGAGKTTLFRTLMGLLPPVSGAIATCECDTPIAYLPQRSQLDELAPLRGRDVVAMGLERGRSFLRPFLSRQQRAQVEWALDAAGATPLSGQAYRELSEGQKQRVLMARLLASRPELAVLDEPTAAMDEVAEQETMSLIDDLRRQHDLAVMIVSHHLAVVGRFADRVLFIDRDAHAAVGGTPRQVFSDPAFVARYGELPMAEQPDAR